VTTEEQRLSEMLHRLTPEPPRRVTVEDIAIRLANKNAPARGAARGVTRMSGGNGAAGGGRPRRGRFSPLLAAAAVVVIAGASAGVAVALSSHTSSPPSTGGGAGHLSGVAASATNEAATTPASPAGISSTLPTVPVSSGQPVTDGAWGASVVASVSLTAGSLAASGNSLYAFNADDLLEIDPSTGQTIHEAPANGFPGAPVVAGNKVWQITDYGGTVVVTGYNPQTLAAEKTITVPVSGLPSGNPQGILAAGPAGTLYVAAGNTVAEVSASSGQVIRRFPAPGGAAVNSLAVSPDGSRIYASVGAQQGQLVEFSGSTGAEVASFKVGQQGASSLVGTPGGVVFITSGGMAARVWFAPAGNLSGARVVAGPADGGEQAIPTYVNGAIWVGGTKKVECLDPATGQVRASAYVPSDDQVPEGIGDIVVADGHVFALYVNNRTEQGGVAVLNPPAACTGGSSSGGSGS
jgi:outer membrane protein assembly factor BamB